MSKLHIDTSSLQKLTFVAHPSVHTSKRGAPTIHKNMGCTIESLVSYHQTMNQSTYLMNCIHFEGAPFAYTHNNKVDGFFGKQSMLTYLPSQPMLRKLTKSVGVAGSVGALAMTATFIGMLSKLAPSFIEDLTERLYEEGTLRRKVLHTIQLVTMVAIVYAVYMQPFKRLFSHTKDMMPFSSYPLRSQTHGKWKCVQQYDRNSQCYIMVFAIPIPCEQKETEWCAIRLVSSPTTTLQREFTHEFKPATVDTCVVNASLRKMGNILNTSIQWYGSAWASLWSMHNDVSTMTIPEYNNLHSKDVHQSIFSIHDDNLFLPFLNFTSDEEKRALHQRGMYHALLPTTKLPTLLQHSITTRYKIARKSLVGEYIHLSSLHTTMVHHLFVIPLYISKVFDTSMKEAFEKMLVHADTLDTMKNHVKNVDIRKCHMLCLFISTNSNRIDHTRDKSAQLYHMYETHMDVCMLSQAATFTQLYKELQSSSIGATPYNFSPSSSFVRKHDLQLVFYKQFNTSYHHLYKIYKAHLQDEQKELEHTNELDNAHDIMQKHERVRSQAELNQIIRYYKQKHAHAKKMNHVTQRLQHRLHRMKHTDGKPSHHKGTIKSNALHERTSHDLTPSEIELLLKALHDSQPNTQHTKRKETHSATARRHRRRTQRAPAVAKQIIIH